MIQYDWFSFDCNYLPRSFVVHFFFVADVHGCASACGESNMYSFDRRFDYAAFLKLELSCLACLIYLFIVIVAVYLFLYHEKWITLDLITPPFGGKKCHLSRPCSVGTTQQHGMKLRERKQGVYAIYMLK